MRIADVQLTFPSILIALLIDGTVRGLVGNFDRETMAFWVLTFSIGLSFWVQYARNGPILHSWWSATRNTFRPQS